MQSGENNEHNMISPTVYAAWTKDDLLRFQSTSGGIFTELAYEILSQGGYVCGARYDRENNVEHCIVHDADGVAELRQSKYTQSAMLDTYPQVRELLERGKKVAFCGAPCQVAGLKAFLGREYSDLITFDFICRGVNSPKAYRSWLEEIEGQERSRVTNVWFKYKEGGWKTSPKRTRVTFEDGHMKIYEKEENLFMVGYLGPNLYIRKCCGDCRFKGLPRQGDITLADFWGVAPQYDTDQGTSMVLVNSEKGQALWESVAGRIEFHKQSFEALLSANPMFGTSVNIHPKSEEFLHRISGENFSEMVIKYARVSLWERINRKLAHFLGDVEKRMHTNRDGKRSLLKATAEGSLRVSSWAGDAQSDPLQKPVPVLYAHKKDCVGCSACRAVCPMCAIEMIPDEEGFLYPRIRESICIRCQRCINVCPVEAADQKSASAGSGYSET